MILRTATRSLAGPAIRLEKLAATVGFEPFRGDYAVREPGGGLRGEPAQNVFLESNGWPRNKCLDQHWGGSLQRAYDMVAAWRTYDNTRRSQSALRQVEGVVRRAGQTVSRT